jgi:RNA polymerase sigma-70 factor (ECF subfamily)
MPVDETDETSLLKLAGDGDPDAFSKLAQTYRAELRAHCYRILGSMHDAEDALQEAMLRAWRGMSGFQGRGSLRAWLYSIATNTALDIAKHRSRRELPVDFGPAAGVRADLDQALTDAPWLEPYPDRWLASDTGPSPEARYEQRESVELAFVVALQHLPPSQRAVLLLREVVGFSAAEIASQLGTSAAAVTSALQRARASVDGRLPARSQQATLRTLGDRRTRDIVERYADAIERGDADTLISMLTEDATWSMPPIPSWFRGHEAIREFLTRYPLTVRWKHRPAWANGQLAVGCYYFDEGKGEYFPAVIDVLTLDGEKIAAVTAFHTADAVDEPSSALVAGAELFRRFGLPSEPG